MIFQSGSALEKNDASGSPSATGDYSSTHQSGLGLPTVSSPSTVTANTAMLASATSLVGATDQDCFIDSTKSLI